MRVCTGAVFVIIAAGWSTWQDAHRWKDWTVYFIKWWEAACFPEACSISSANKKSYFHHTICSWTYLGYTLPFRWELEDECLKYTATTDSLWRREKKRKKKQNKTKDDLSESARACKFSLTVKCIKEKSLSDRWDWQMLFLLCVNSDNTSLKYWQQSILKP